MVQANRYMYKASCIEIHRFIHVSSIRKPPDHVHDSALISPPKPTRWSDSIPAHEYTVLGRLLKHAAHHLHQLPPQRPKSCLSQQGYTPLTKAWCGFSRRASTSVQRSVDLRTASGSAAVNSTNRRCQLRDILCRKYAADSARVHRGLR